MGGRCLGGEGSNEVEDVRVEKEWDGRCQGGEGSDGVEDVRVEKEATEWKIKMQRVSWASSLRSVSFLPAHQP